MAVVVLDSGQTCTTRKTVNIDDDVEDVALIFWSASSISRLNLLIWPENP